ncbi:uncharacterized protein CMU_019850 [Cryptosporidium muris RN66]|uniref:Ankyrin repeat-containing protein n=1 Tax=Cryptosporidium muris (strain RN66) TaxID=441375 RepID=B6AJA4_CRYMR|nr:uncharacterized protein CMU_019850 [Cryptosporidium muris RN66]EEA08242.1 hypothetical protein, conserved [Cryptosporidium muris RN66]|eukprot:XP_002142591.1 hypothetical protein [Cryptosporidium muris RN66]
MLVFKNFWRLYLVLSIKQIWLFFYLVKCKDSSVANLSDYVNDHTILWLNFTSEPFRSNINYTIRVDRMMNAIENLDIQAVEEFLKLDEYSISYYKTNETEGLVNIYSLYDNAPGWGGETPLTILSRHSTPRSSIMMYYLSLKGMSSEKAQIRGYTPLILAIMHKNFGAVKVLLELAERQYAFQPHSGISDIENNQILPNNFTKRKFTLIDARDYTGRTALFHAVLTEDEKLVSLLLNVRANPNIRDISGVTPLLVAASNNLLSIVRLLLYNGADQTITDNNNNDPLSVAIKMNHPDIVTCLLEDPTFYKNYLNRYSMGHYKSYAVRPPYHVRRLLDILRLLQVQQSSIINLFRIEYARQDTSLCDVKDEEGRSLLNVITSREMYALLGEILEFYRNATKFKYQGFTSCNPHLLDKSSKGPIDFLLSNTINSSNFQGSSLVDIKQNNIENTNIGNYLDYIDMSSSYETRISHIDDRDPDPRQVLLASLLQLSNPLDYSSYLFELLRKGGTPTASTINAMVRSLKDPSLLFLHRISRDGHNALTFALFNGQIAEAREILNILIDYQHLDNANCRSALKLAINHASRTGATSVITEIALRSPETLHEWICERDLTNVISVDQLKFVFSNLPRDFEGFSKRPNLCKPLYTIVKKILDSTSQIDSADIVAVMLHPNAVLPFLDSEDVAMTLKIVGVSLSLSAILGLTPVLCTEWISQFEYFQSPYCYPDTETTRDQTEQRNTQNNEFVPLFWQEANSGFFTLESNHMNPRVINWKKRKQVLDLVFSCPLRKVDPTLKAFQERVLIILLIALIFWIACSSFTIVYSSRSQHDVCRFVPILGQSNSENLYLTKSEWKTYRLIRVLKFISLLYCIIVLTSVGRVRHVVYTGFLLALGALLRANQLLSLRGNDATDIATAFIREELTEKENNIWHKDLDDNAEEIHEQAIRPNKNLHHDKQKQDLINDTVCDEFDVQQTLINTGSAESQKSFQNDIIEKEQISVEQYANVTLLVGICAFGIAVASNIQRYLFGNFREFYRYNESYNFVTNNIHIAVFTEVILVINTWILAFAILKVPSLLILMLQQRIQVIKYFLHAYPDINYGMFNSVKRNVTSDINSEGIFPPNFSNQFSTLNPSGAVFIPPGRFDIVLCQWVRVRHAIMRRMHRRYLVACRPYNNIYFVIGLTVALTIWFKHLQPFSIPPDTKDIFYFTFLDEFGFTLLMIFAAYSITLLVIVWLANHSNIITETLHWKLFWDAFSFMPPCSAQQIVLQHIKLTQDLDTEDRRVALWGIPITNNIRNLVFFLVIGLWVYIIILGISKAFLE